MNNRRLDYNPLFESIIDSAKRYEKISEELSQEEKTKYAIEYARKIIEICYSQYIFFVNCIPDNTLKNKAIEETVTFLKNQNVESINFRTFFDAMIVKMNELSNSISGNQAIRNLANFSDLQKIYQKFESGVKILQDEVVKKYEKQYSTEITSPKVTEAVKSFVKFTYEALDQSLKSTKK